MTLYPLLLQHFTATRLVEKGVATNQLLVSTNNDVKLKLILENLNYLLLVTKSVA